LFTNANFEGRATMSGAVPSGFRRRLQAGEPVVGSFVNLASALTTEIMGIAGLDWVVLDLEHGAGDESILTSQLHALRGSNTAALVRIEAIDLPRFMHALDLGADGVLVPRLRSADDARRCVEYCRYSGSRGVARYNRGWHWGHAKRTLADADAEVVCAVQIETAEALAAVDEIAAVDGVDVIFMGPADLSHSLGMSCPPDDPALLARAAPIAEAARRHGKSAGVLTGTLTQLRAYRDLGFSFLGCNSDGGLLVGAATELAAGLHELAAAAADSTVEG
jgi:2-keto-3-deoxy-L-rhamnonate aldolase RhmA